MGAFDALVEISPHIGDDFAPTLPRLLIEGGVHASACAVPDQDPRPAAAGSHSVVLFSGALDENSGIEHLLGAFALLEDDSLVLRILGKGQYLDAVLGAAQRDRRIDYVGYVDNEQAVAMQRSADVLVSPRLPDDHTTRYTFPSKLMEYLATGNVVVSSRLPGIGADYIDHLVVPRDDSDQALADCLAEAVRLAPADHQRRQAQLDFMATKSWTTRSGELVEFLTQRVAP
jgi:glycosyltransferase involved in cell wall biosynthesis